MGDVVSPWIDVALPAAQTSTTCSCRSWPTDLHSVPTQITLIADGTPARTLPIPTLSSASARRHGEDGRRALRSRDRRPTSRSSSTGSARRASRRRRPTTTRCALPISIADATVPGVPVPASPATIDTGCRTDLVTVDGQPFPVAIRGASDDGPHRSRPSSACADALPLDPGKSPRRHRRGPRLGVERRPPRAVVGRRRTPRSGHAGRRADHRVGRARADHRHDGRFVPPAVRTDGTPFWLVLGQSHNDGWEATVDGRSLGSPHLVNGFANGWTVHPGTAGTIDIVLRWTPQRSVWIGLIVSGVAVLVCLLLVFVRRRRVATVDGPDAPRRTERGVARDVRRRGTVGRDGAGRGRHRRGGDCARLAVVDRRDRGRGDGAVTVARTRADSSWPPVHRSRSRWVRCSTCPSSAGSRSGC